MMNQAKRFVLSLLLISVALTAQAKRNTTRGVIKAIQAAKEKNIFRNATIGLYAVNLTRGKVISAINADLGLVPASNLKILTTAAALETLGQDFRFKTTIQYDGEIDDQGTLHGNLYIKGGGDPTLGSTKFSDHYYQSHFMETWSQAIQEKGIKKVEGAVMGDAQIYADSMIPDTWVGEDIGNYYGAGYSGLSIFDNMYTILFDSDTEEGVSTKIVDILPALPDDVKLINHVKSSSINRDLAYIYGGPYENTKIIRGTIPQGRKNFAVKGASPDPAYWATYTLHESLKEQGVQVMHPPTTLRREQKKYAAIARKDIHTTYSPPLYDIIKEINQKSFNLYAEHLLTHLGLIALGRGDTQSGTKALKKFWADRGIDVTGMLLSDGSGLSKYNAVTPKQLVEALCYMKTSENFALFYESLPIIGETGTLASLFKEAPLRGNISAKSGSLSGIRSFSGYYTTVKGDEAAFSIIVNNYDGTRSSADKELENMLTALVKQRS